MKTKRILSVLITVLAFVALRMAVAPATSAKAGRVAVEYAASQLEAPDAFTLIGTRSFLDGYDPVAASGNVNVVVEIPAGSVDKWEVDKEDGSLRWELRDGKPRKVDYLGYPGNYGMIPRTLLPKAQGGDGDPLDVLVLGPAVPRGSVVEARIVGVLHLLDGGEQDDKLLAVLSGTALGEVEDLQGLRARFPGVTDIVETFFSHYKGPGELETLGFGNAQEANAILETAVRAFEASHDGS